MDGRQDPELSLNAMKRRVREFYARQKELRDAECRVNEAKAGDNCNTYGKPKGVGCRTFHLDRGNGRGPSFRELR